MANKFFVGVIDSDWNDTGNWSATSGGAGGAGVPSSTDDAFFDANSPDCVLDVSPIVFGIDFTGYVNTITGTGFTLQVGLIASSSGAILASTATYTNFDLIMKNATTAVDFNNATIRDLTLINTTTATKTITFTGSKINLTGELKLETTTTGATVCQFETNNPDITLNNVTAVAATTGDNFLRMGSGTWFYTGNTFDVSTFEAGKVIAGTSTLQIDMNDANFTWNDTNQTLHNVTINFNHTTLRNFNSTPGTTITITGVFEVHVLNTADLVIDFRTYVCPDGFVSEEASTGELNIDGTTDITTITCRAGIGTNEVDLRGLAAISNIINLNIGDADYTFRPGSVTIQFPNFFSTLLTTTTRTITVAGNTFVVGNHWDLEFTDNASCDPLDIIFTGCEYAPVTGTYQNVNTKNAATDFNLTMGTQNWLFPINNFGATGHGTFLNDVNVLTPTTGVTTFQLSSTDVTDLDLRTELNDVIIHGGTGTRSVAFESTRAPVINGSLTIEVTAAGAVTLDYNPAQIFEVKGNFVFQVNGGAGSYVLDMGSNVWKFGGDITIGSGAQITLDSETANIELNGIVTQTITLDSTQMNTVTVSNITSGGVIFDDATDFTALAADADTDDIAIRFKAALTHNINNLTLTGTGSNVVNLRSTILDTQWKIIVTGTETVDHVNVRDSDNSGSANAIDVPGTNSVDAGNNINWDFGITDADFQIVQFGQLVTVTGLRIPVAVAHNLEFAQTPSVIRIQPASVSHIFELTQDPAIIASMIVDVSQVLEFAQGTVAQDPLECDPDTTVILDNVSFWFPYVEMTNRLILPRPEIGDEHEAHTRVVARHTRGGTLRAYNQGFVFEVFNFTFTGLNRNKRDEVIAFAKLSRADIVRFRDHENRVWRGMIVSSPTVLVSTGRSSPGGEDYSVAMSFEGSQIA